MDVAAHATYHVKGDVLEISSSPSLLHPVSDLSNHISKSTLDHLELKINGLRAIDGSYKTAQEQKNHLKDEASEASRLAALFPGLDSNLEIIAIKEMLVQGCIAKERAPPRFFDGLLYVMEQDWKRCAGVLTICIELIPEEKYDENIFRVSGVLNELILHSNLQSLTLKHFSRQLLLDSLATLRCMEQLDYLDVSHNSLELSGIDFVLQLLPDDPIDPIVVNFEHNNITDEDDVGLVFRFQPNLKSVKIADQESRKLDIARIRDRMNNASVELL